MQLFAFICNAILMNIDKHQFSYLLLFPLLLNMTAGHTQAKTNTVSLYSFFWVIPQRFNFICNVSEHYLFLLPSYTTYEARTGREFWNVGKYNSDSQESSKRKNTTFRTCRKFEIKKHTLLLHCHSQFVLHSNNNTL